jgi:uncharacterized protein YciI
MGLFVVTSEQDAAWVASRAMREQELWTEHADFINGLYREGFVLLGGPLGPGTPHRALLIVQAAAEQVVRSRLATDPWVRAGILRVVTVEAWKILVSNDKLDPVLGEIIRP